MQKVKWDCGILISYGYIIFFSLPHKRPTKILACPTLSAVSYAAEDFIPVSTSSMFLDVASCFMNLQRQKFI